MKEENSKGLLYLLAGLMVLSMVLSFVVISKVSKQDSLSQADLDMAIASIPQAASAEEIAALVVVPEVEVPEVENADNKALNIYLEREFSAEYDELEDEAYALALEDLEYKDFKDLKSYLEDSIEGFDKFKSMSVNDYEVEVVQIGLDDEEDKEAMVYFKVKFRYVLEDGAVEQYKDYAYVSYNVLFTEGDFSDEELSSPEYSLEKLEIFE